MAQIEHELRVALVGPNFPPQVGGVELYLERLAIGLVELGCAVDVLVQQRHCDAGAAALEVRAPGLVVRRFQSRTHSRRFPVAPSLAFYLRSNSYRYDIVHGHSFHAAPAAMAAMVSNIDFVFTAHYHATGHTPAAKALHYLYAPIGRRAFSRAKAVIAVSRHEASLISKSYPFCADRVQVVYAGVDVDTLRLSEPYALEVPVALVSGRLERYKQVDIALKAFALVGMPALLVVTGDGPERARLEDLSSRLGIRERVLFTGQVAEEELRRWQATARVVLSLSRHEAFGLSLLEGIAAGARAIASEIPASREIAELAPSNVQFVKPDATPEAVAKALMENLVAGRPSPATGLPSWKGLAARCTDIYRSVLCEHNEPLPELSCTA